MVSTAFRSETSDEDIYSDINVFFLFFSRFNLRTLRASAIVIFSLLQSGFSPLRILRISKFFFLCSRNLRISNRKKAMLGGGRGLGKEYSMPPGGFRPLCSTTLPLATPCLCILMFALYLKDPSVAYLARSGISQKYCV